MDPSTSDFNRLPGRRTVLVSVASAAALLIGSALSASPAMAEDNLFPSGTQDQSPFVTSGDSAPFDRSAAVAWAVAHAKDNEPLLYPACTWFVTQALWAGGVPKNPGWTSDGSHGEILRVPGTSSATAVQPFLDQLFTSYPGSKLTQLSMSQNAVPDAQAGDLIVYSWNGQTWDHLSMITEVQGDGYPNVSEWGVYNSWTPWQQKYVKRGWTWSQNSQTWLQSKNPSMQAGLVHIDTTIPTTY